MIQALGMALPGTVPALREEPSTFRPVDVHRGDLRGLKASKPAATRDDPRSVTERKRQVAVGNESAVAVAVLETLGASSEGRR